MNIYEDFTSLTMGIHEKIYLQTYKNNQYIWLKKNTAQLYLILDRADLFWIFSQYTKDGSDIYRFSYKKWVLTPYTAGNLRTSGASLNKMVKNPTYVGSP